MEVSSNIIVLLAKRHIYRCKVRNGPPSLNLFKSELKNYILSEKYYASTSDTMIKFTRKWNSYAAFWRTEQPQTTLVICNCISYVHISTYSLFCLYFIILYWLSTCFFFFSLLLFSLLIHGDSNTHWQDLNLV